MREFVIEQKGTIVTCWTTDSPKFGFRFDKSDPMAQYCLTIIYEGSLDTVEKMRLLTVVSADFDEFARMRFPSLFHEPKPRLGKEEVELR